MEARPYRIATWLVWIAIAVLTLAFFLPGLFRRPGHGHTTFSGTCMANLGRIGFGIEVYDADNGGMPGDRWMDQTLPYLGSDPAYTAAFFRCPALASGYGYALNGWTTTKRFAALPKPGILPLVYDSESLAWNAEERVLHFAQPPRHDGRVNLIFADRHAVSMPASVLRQFRAQP